MRSACCVCGFLLSIFSLKEKPCPPVALPPHKVRFASLYVRMPRLRTGVNWQRTIYSNETGLFKDWLCKSAGIYSGCCSAKMSSERWISRMEAASTWKARTSLYPPPSFLSARSNRLFYDFLWGCRQLPFCSFSCLCNRQHLLASDGCDLTSETGLVAMEAVVLQHLLCGKRPWQSQGQISHEFHKLASPLPNFTAFHNCWVGCSEPLGWLLKETKPIVNGAGGLLGSL